MSSLLSVTDLEVDFHTVQGRVEAVRGVSFDLAAGESMAIVGESGSGKSVTSLALLGLVGEVGEVRGRIVFQGRDLVGVPEAELRDVRGAGVSLVFQDSLDALNPVYTVGAQISEILRVRLGWSRQRAREEALHLMQQVGIPDAHKRIGNYPHQFSGGMRQRICIAMAIALKPKLLVADEPTTALDVTVQAEILRLLRALQRESGMSLIFVTHDLAVARLIATRIIVMHGGRVVERGLIDDIFDRPRHPYTKALLAAHPGRVASWKDLRPIPENLTDEAPVDAPADQLPKGPVEEIAHGI